MNGALTDDHLVTAIGLALEARDMPAVEELLMALAVRNPTRAQEVIDVMRAGISIARGAR